MFTPPPSPRPYQVATPISSPSAPSEKASGKATDVQGATQVDTTKRRTGRRFRLAVISVPLVVIILTLYASYSTSHAAQETFDFPHPPPLTWHALFDDPLRRMHKRHPMPVPQSGPFPSTIANAPSGSGTSATPTSSSSTASSTIPISEQPVPTVPSSTPAVPTPFPQPFDGVLAQNFSSQSCALFFSNMTSTTPFRSCRPFSLLLQTSDDFIDAQTNLTLLNSIIWGTCNTNTVFNQCKLNMSWFASTLKTSCSQELSQSSAMAVNTLTALQAFEVMHDVGCLQDPSTNTYCYLDAVRSSTPSDAYYYGLPFGTKLPNTTTPSCSPCSKSVMSSYASALDSSQTALLTGLRATYESAAALSAQFCGADFAQTGVVSGATSLGGSTSRTLGFLVVFITGLLLHLS